MPQDGFAIAKSCDQLVGIGTGDGLWRCQQTDGSCPSEGGGRLNRGDNANHWNLNLCSDGIQRQRASRITSHDDQIGRGGLNASPNHGGYTEDQGRIGLVAIREEGCVRQMENVHPKPCVNYRIND